MQIPASADRLSVIMIAKNEAGFIGDCLQSVKDVADQIIVVDTGSTDETVEIAKGHGAELHHMKWGDDFSAARNKALAHARGSWILFIDADEELMPEGMEELHPHGHHTRAARRRHLQPPDQVQRAAEGDELDRAQREG